MGSIFGRGKSKDKLCDAVSSGNMDLIKALLQKEPSLVNVSDNYGNTPLHTAVEKGNIRIVEFLIQNGADVNAKDNEGRTPAYFAEVRGNYELEDLLRKCGSK